MVTGAALAPRKKWQDAVMLTKYVSPLLTLLCCCTTALAETPPLPYAGVWVGTLGKNKVQVCFTNDRDSNYFDLHHQRGITLRLREGDDSPRSWEEKVRDPKTFEEQTSGVWQLHPPQGKTLQGVWTSSRTHEKRPLQLQQLAKLDNTECGPVFYAPLINAMTFKTGTLPFEDKVLKSITTPTSTAFEVPVTTANSAKLNAFIKKWLEQQVVESYQCKTNGGEDWAASLTPVLWTNRWLAVQDLMPETYCGGAHGSYNISYATFDTTTGQRQNVWLWVSKQADGGDLTASGNKTTKLRKLIEKRNPGRAEGCDDSFWLGEPHPTKSGLVFSTSYYHAARNCNNDVVITYKDLAPFLTPAGKAAVQSIVQGE
jgi:hypothetical protein